MSPQTATNTNIDDIVDDIVYNIKAGNVIPILGYDLLSGAQSSPDERDFLKNLIKIHSGNEQLDELYSGSKSGNDLINAYYHHLRNDDKRTFKGRLSKTIRNERIRLDLIPDSLRKLMSIKHFNFFINATFTNSPELAYNAYRAQGTTAAELRDSYNVYNFHSVHPDDLPSQAPERDFYVNFEKPTIYNLFGTHDEAKGYYVITDADHIELIYDLIRNVENRFVNLLSYLNEGNLLLLGCNFPDWFFRFFIRICVGDRLDKKSPIERKMVIDRLNSLDQTRTIFIDQYKIKSLDIDCIELVNRIYQSFIKEPGAPDLVKDKENNKVFISYCREDEPLAKAIAKQMDEAFIEYFLDSQNLRLGDRLDGKIADAIRKCCIFLPVVSQAVEKASPYIWREWNHAVNIGKEKIWPVYKEFIDPETMSKLDLGFALNADIGTRILSRNNSIGIVPPSIDTPLSTDDLIRIKNEQYLSRVSGEKIIKIN